ncbi:MAG TPA: ATP-binding protein [Longimicrobiaceae bacterium]|nr:ATP-binding protein [Longimicrobiaceae bacterium]
MSERILQVHLHAEGDVVAARQRARDVAARLGFERQDQTRIATAVSEIARNAFRYAGGGTVDFMVSTAGRRAALEVRVADRGPGIADLDAVLDGRYRSQTGMGMGIAGTRRLMDRFELTSVAGEGTIVVFARELPAAAPLPAGALPAIAAELARTRPEGPAAEVQRQNQELLRTLDDLRSRETELLRLNQELEDTNRGVVALYAELDDNVEQLRRSAALRAQFVSYMSHEFRTPLDSIIALTGILLARIDGELEDEQEKQVTLVQRSARDLLNLVDDMLDTMRFEAGQVTLRLGVFDVGDLFTGLRATLRPLRTITTVGLHFEEPENVPPLQTDEGKLSQVLRNLVANALKFTERGHIRVTAAGGGDGWVTFAVEDTGVGITRVDQERIFQDFTQVDGAVQRRVRGSGLGLPLSRKLTELLGGTLTTESEPGVGSVFTVRIPAVHPSLVEHDGDAADDDGERAYG